MNDAVVSDGDREELELFRENVRRFVAEVLVPSAGEWERSASMPRDTWNLLGDAGLLCVDIPAEYGGAGAPVDFSAVMIEELARAGMNGLAGLIAVHSDIVAHYLLDAGTEKLKQKYLPKMVTGEFVGAIAMTEPAAGSDLQGIRSTAVRDVDGFVINGTKTFITNGEHCDFVITVARTDMEAKGSHGTSLFIVDCDASGFSRGQRLEKIGQHTADTTEIFYDNVRVSPLQVLGELNRGFHVLMKELPRERWVLALISVAACEAALRWTVEYVLERKAFGGSLADLQTVRFRIAEMHAEATVHRVFVDHCLRLLRQGSLDAATASIAKLSCTEAHGRVVDGCLQLFGGYGYMREYPIARAFVDARAQRIYGGTSEIMKHIISQSVLGR